MGTYTFCDQGFLLRELGLDKPPGQLEMYM